MAKSQHDSEDRRLRRKTAAFRLKHDIGKAVRWSAPEEREANAEELRDRLRRDLLSRASGGGAGRDVLEIFLEWKREEGPLFAGGDSDLVAMERAMTEVGRFAPRLAPALLPFRESSSFSSLSPSSSEAKSSSSPLSESQLVALDEACLEASRACTAFYRRIAVEDGPETIRPHGARR
jgi:hypothetical protein